MGKKENSEQKSDEIATHSEITRETQRSHAPYTPHQRLWIERAPEMKGPRR